VIGEASTFTPTVCTGTPPLIRTFRYQMDAVDVGAQDLAYNPVDADVTHLLRVVETISNQYGSVIGTSAGVAVTSGAEQYIVGQTLYVNLPSGMVGTIQIQRNGVSIAGALSAASVGSYAYTIVAADADCALTPLVTSIAWDTAAPRRFSTAVQIAEPNKIAYTYDENLDPTSVPATSDFAALTGTIATAKTATAVEVVGNICKVTYSSNFVPGDQPIAGYTPGTNKLRDLAHTPNNAVAFSGIYVWNNYPPPATAGTLATTETTYSVGGGGFVSSGVGGNFNYAARLHLAAYGDHGVQLLEEGWIEMQVADSNATVRAIGLNSSGSDYLLNFAECVRLASGVVRAYALSTAVGSPYTFASPSALCRVRLFRAMPVGTITMETSEDGGVSWTTRYTFAATDGGVMWPLIVTQSATVAVIGAAIENFEDRGY
jgi:hypothetical protein